MKIKNNIYLINRFLNINIAFNDCFFVVDKLLINKLFYNLFFFFNIKKYISITLVNSNYILYLNKKFNNKNIYTNVLSFKFYSNLKFNLLGDIIICPKILLMESIKKNKNHILYFLYILIHGFLHLINFNHKKFNDYKKMKFFEYFFLNILF